MELSFDKIIRLEFFHSKYTQELKSYQLATDQVQFTAHPLEALIKCEEEGSRLPIVILFNDRPAGFFVLHRDGAREYSDNPRALFLRAYSIDLTYQGKGVAKGSLQLLPTFVKEHFPEINEVILAVNHQNKIAQHVYRSSGFTDKGIRAMGRIGEMYIFNLEL